MDDDYRVVNRANWDERVPVHVASEFYAVDRLAADPAALTSVVRFDVPRLGDITGLRGVHLQCHIGTDTISLARLGAHMTGLDFSGVAIAEARRLAARAGAAAEFVEADVYAAEDVLGAARFDLVYTGIGALCWMPDIRRWAAVVASLLAPGGRLFLREGHPVLWAIDERHREQLVIDYPYFETAEPIVFEDPTTYVDGEARLEHAVTISWNHGLGEIVSALLDEGLVLTQLVEHETVPWEALPGQMEQSGELREWRLVERPERLPLTYTLQAVKRS
ncbi:MAG TPA: class I SAM-dependent methyltransferase [Jatrophihabitantaceae bacterium]